MIPASVALERAGIDPASLGFDGTDLGTVGFEVMPGWLRAMVGSRVDGLTIGERVFLTHDAFAAVVRGERPGIVVHELTHVRQWREGAWMFMRRYVREYLRLRLLGLPHHGAYLGIPLEIEARDAARAFTADPPAPRFAGRVPPETEGRSA